MIQEIRVPEIGESVETGEVVKVLVAVGDVITVDQPVAELETDKAVLELPSTVAGRVQEILIEEGDTIEIGQVVFRVDTDGDAAAVPSPAQKPAAPSPRAEPTTKKPAAKESTSRPSPDASHNTVAAGKGARVPAAPALRRLARELGVDLGAVSGSGTGGRISADDVKAYVRSVMSGAESARQAKAADLPDFDRWGTVERKPQSKVRRIMAKNMSKSWTTIPHVTQHDRADVTGLETFRRKASARVEAAGGKLTVTAILVKVCAAGLKAFPQFNTSLDTQSDELIYKSYCNIGIAVDTERGLIVPVIQNADQKSLTQIAVEMTDLATRTRQKKVKLDELEGGTFTISNLGGIGGTGFTPIVYAPQVAILGVARTQREVRMVDDQPQERLLLPLSLSYDHRVIDGADGARFLGWIVEALQNPYLAVLGA